MACEIIIHEVTKNKGASNLLEKWWLSVHGIHGLAESYKLTWYIVSR